MKKIKGLIVLCTLSIFPALSQWTIPRLVDSTITATQSNPRISVGPNREIVVFFNESSTPSKLVCYKSTDLGTTFVRIVISQSGSRPPWYSWSAGTTASAGFDRSGSAFLFLKSSYSDDIALFASYVVTSLRRDSAFFTARWSVAAPGGLSGSTLAAPIMVVEDTVLHVLRDIRQPSYEYTFVYTRLSGDSLRNRKDFVMFRFPNGYFGGSLASSQVAVHGALSVSAYSPRRFKLYYTVKLHRDSTFAPMVSVDTNYATSPLITDLGSGNFAILYAAGNGDANSDSLLVFRTFTEGSISFSPPSRLTCKPIRPLTTSSTESNRAVMRSYHEDRHLVYRSYNPTPLVAYYRFGSLQDPPLDSTFFQGFDYGDIAVDSMGGKFIVMVGADGKVYLTKKDIVLGLEGKKTTLPLRFALHPNYPNPFNPTTTIRFELPTSTFTSLKVYDLLGREVSILVSEMLQAGTHNVKWSAEILSSGVYLCRLDAAGFVLTRKLLLLR